MEVSQTSTLGTTISTNEIVDGAVTFDKLGGQNKAFILIGL